MIISKLDITSLADVFENFVKTCTDGIGINPLYNYSLPGYTWEAELNFTKLFLGINQR